MQTGLSPVIVTLLSNSKEATFSQLGDDEAPKPCQMCSLTLWLWDSTKAVMCVKEQVAEVSYLSMLKIHTSGDFSWKLL